MTPRQKLADSAPALALYALTLLCEMPAVTVRMVIAAVPVYFLDPALGFSTANSPLTIAAGYAPLAWSALALIWPGTGWWWMQRQGGREPSRREKLAYQDAIEDLKDPNGKRLPLPHGWFVLDDEQPAAAALGQDLMLTRGMLEEPQLAAVIAHELGHLATLDGRLTVALNRLYLWPPPKDRRPAGLLVGALRLVAAFVRGGTSLKLLGPLWAHWWRDRELKADRYAARLGKADELITYLEIHVRRYDRPIPFLWLTEHTHPAAEHRIDLLQEHAEIA